MKNWKRKRIPGKWYHCMNWRLFFSRFIGQAIWCVLCNLQYWSESDSFVSFALGVLRLIFWHKPFVNASFKVGKFCFSVAVINYGQWIINFAFGTIFGVTLSPCVLQSLCFRLTVQRLNMWKNLEVCSYIPCKSGVRIFDYYPSK